MRKEFSVVKSVQLSREFIFPQCEITHFSLPLTFSVMKAFSKHFICRHDLNYLVYVLVDSESFSLFFSFSSLPLHDLGLPVMLRSLP